MSLDLTTVGDISFGDFPFCPGFGIRSSFEKNANFDPFSGVGEHLIKSDFVFANLETVLSDANLDRNSLVSWEMRGFPAAADYLKKYNVNVVNVANNHILQHGLSSFDQTVELLKKNQLNVVGLCREHQSVPLILEKEGIVLGFIGYAFETDSHIADQSRYSQFAKYEICSQIEQLKKKVDLVVVSCHWGLEFMDYPSQATIEMARLFVDNGANIVLGHHPHTLQGVECYNDSYIVYSMGNFLFDMVWNDKFKKSCIYKFKINSNKNIQLIKLPIIYSKNYNIKNYDCENFNSYLDYLDSKLGKIKTDDIERFNAKYYIEFEKLRIKNRYKSYSHFLKNIYKVNPRLLKQVLLRSLLRKIPKPLLNKGE